jgi:hypothetical protein
MPFSRASEDVGYVLAEKVRVLTLNQIRDLWFADSKDPSGTARRFIRKLVASGVVLSTTEMLYAEPNVSKPLLEWEPTSEEEPDLGRLSWKACSRHKGPPVRTVVVRIADARQCRATSLMHDVMLSRIFLNHLHLDPTVFARWTHEDQMRATDRVRFNHRVPDALLREEDRDVLIECISSYDKRRLTETFNAWRPYPFRFY